MHRLEAKRKEKRSISEAKSNTIFCKRRNIYKSASPLTKVLGLHATKSLLHQSKTKITKGGQVHATLASRSAAEVGIAEAAPASGGGTDPLVTGVEEIGAVEVAEAAEGEIIAMMPGAYLFAFSKKASSSERGWLWEELTFSQLISSPCAYGSAMAPSAPCFKERPFIRRMGSSGVSKAMVSFFTSLSGTSAFCLGHNPTEIRISTRLTNSKISWIDI
jgi:hypothetical protein